MLEPYGGEWLAYTPADFRTRGRTPMEGF